MNTTNLHIKTTDTVSGKTFEGDYPVPSAVSDKLALYGEDVVNFCIESRIKSTLRHKCNVLLQNETPIPEINATLAAWKPTVKTLGKITEEKIKAEKDPIKRKEMIAKKVAELQGLDDL